MTNDEFKAYIREQRKPFRSRNWTLIKPCGGTGFETPQERFEYLQTILVTVPNDLKRFFIRMYYREHSLKVIYEKTD